MNEVEITHERAMQMIQKEWEENKALYLERRNVIKGIRSSQISAVIMFLIKIGVIKIEDVSG